MHSIKLTAYILIILYALTHISICECLEYVNVKIRVSEGMKLLYASIGNISIL